MIDGYTQPGASPNTNGPGLGDNAVLKIQVVPNQARAVRTGCASPLAGARCGGWSSTGSVSSARSTSGPTAATRSPATSSAPTPDGTAQGSSTVYDAVLLQSSNNTIGGTAPADRNLLSGNQGIHVPLNPVADASNNVIQGNFFGLDATGTRVIPNSNSILIESGSGDHIGGTVPGAGNVITGSTADAIVIKLGGPIAGELRNSNGGHVIQGNLIGTDVTGIAVPSFTDGSVTVPGNAEDGIYVYVNNAYHLERDGRPAADHHRRDHGRRGERDRRQSAVGVDLRYPPEFVAPTSIQGNFFGTDRTGTRNLGNG